MNNTSTQNNAVNNMVIGSDAFKKEAQLTIPSQAPDLTPYTAIIDGAITSLPKIQTSVDSATATQNNLLNTLTSRMADLSGRTAYLSEQERLSGVETEQKQLDDYNARANDLVSSMTALSNEAKAIPLAMQEQVRGQGVTDAGLAPLTTAKLRENAIKALTLSSEGEALASRIANSETRLQRAKEKAQQAVDLKYKPMEEEIERVKTFLEINEKYILNPAEKKRVEATNLALAERERLLQDQKENDKKVTDMIITASSQNAPLTVLNNAKKLQTSGAKSSDVAIALGQYAGDYYRTELLKNQILTEKAQRAKILSDMKVKADTVNIYGKPTKVTGTEIQNVNEAGIAKNSFTSLIKQFKDNINSQGTYEMFGASAGEKNALGTNLLLAMKSLEKTGALDKGTIDVLAGTIPDNRFFATKSNQLKKLEVLENTVIGKADEFINSYRGTNAETDPRTSRFYPQQTMEKQVASQLMNMVRKVDTNIAMPTNTSTASMIINNLYKK